MFLCTGGQWGVHVCWGTLGCCCVAVHWGQLGVCALEDSEVSLCTGGQGGASVHWGAVGVCALWDGRVFLCTGRTVGCSCAEEDSGVSLCTGDSGMSLCTGDSGVSVHWETVGRLCARGERKGGRGVPLCTRGLWESLYDKFYLV